MAPAPMRGERLFLAGAAIAIALAIGIGLWLTGGPGTQRAHRLDDRRIADLRAIADALACPGGGATVPDELSEESLARHCPERDAINLTLVDPVDGTPYRYRRIGNRGWEVCARFTDPARISVPRRMVENRRALIRWDRETGCLRREDA